jgi:hypothetical protein
MPRANSSENTATTTPTMIEIRMIARHAPPISP